MNDAVIAKLNSIDDVRNLERRTDARLAAFEDFVRGLKHDVYDLQSDATDRAHQRHLADCLRAGKDSDDCETLAEIADARRDATITVTSGPGGNFRDGTITIPAALWDALQPVINLALDATPTLPADTVTATEQLETT